EWEASIRRDAKGELDWESLNREAQHLKQMPMADLYGAYRPLGPTGNWQYIGPRDLFVPYQSFFGSRGISGRVNGVAYDPNNTNTIYAASSSGGLRKSTDGGTTWQFMSATWDMLHTSCVAVDPRPNNTIYVGTGDYQGSFGGQIQLANGRGYGMGIMKSTDGGQTWVNAVKTSSRAAFGNVAVSKILIVPEAPDTLIVTTGRGQGGFGRVFVSPDGGTTWNPARTASGADLPLAAWGGLAMSIPNGAGARSIYAVAAQPAPRIYRSTDRGATWTSLGAPLTPPSASANFDVACSSFDPNRLYLLSSNYTADNNGNVTSSGDVLVSTNSGGAWSTIANTFSGAWNQAFYNYHITVAPWTDSGNVQRDCVYVGQVDLFASKTGTDSWTSIGLTTTEDAKTHNDQHAMAINPSNPNEALVANDGGVYRLVHNRQTDSVQFTNLSGKLDITEFYSIASHPDNEVRIMGGTQDNGTPSTPLAALSWNDASYWVSLPSGGDGGPCFFAENHSASRYASNNNLRVHKSHNGGQNWEEFSLRTGGTNQNPIFWNGEPTAWQAPFTIDQNQHQYIYAGSSFLYRYNLQTLQWTRFNVTFTNTQGEVLSAITIPRGQSDIIYVGTSLGKVFVSRNFGANWTRIDTPTIAGVNISHIEAHPTNPNQVLISQTALNRKNLYRCADTSAPIAWSDVNGPDGATDPARALRAPIHDIVMDPENPGSVWYAATDLGVIMTRTGGASWTNLTTPYGLPNVQVSDIDFNRTTRYMTIGTYGYGAWRIQVPATSVTLTYPNDEVPQGGSAIGTVTVSEPAPAGGTPVSLTANHTGVTFSSSTVTVPSGSTTASVTTNFAATIPHNTYVTVTATLGGSTSSKTLVVRVPKLRSIFLFMAETYGGSTNVPGTVSL
ncbi:MAG TPA: hypothetical protein VEX38_03180, partial [Fimbriimonadaceae bacterium]|nr:hypothetical protein [Fimbriimonadaceae bacterium]